MLRLPQAASVTGPGLTLSETPPDPLPHSPQVRVTKQTRAKWNPNAKCPNFVRILERQFRDPGEYDYVLALLAKACLIRGNPMKALVLLIGKTDTGKSRVVQAIGHAFGSYARPFERSLFTDRNATEKPRSDMIAARGRRLLYTTEIDDHRLNADAIKRVTGGDAMAAREMYGRHDDGSIGTFGAAPGSPLACTCSKAGPSRPPSSTTGLDRLPVCDLCR